MISPRSYTFFSDRDVLSVQCEAALRGMVGAAKKLDSLSSVARTLRLTLPSVNISDTEDLEADLAATESWSASAKQAGFRWVNQPFLIGQSANLTNEQVNTIVDVIYRTKFLFGSISVPVGEDLNNASQVYAKICKALSRRDRSGFANFRFGIGFRIEEFTPFFPFSNGTGNSMSVALESLPFIRDGIRREGDLGRLAVLLEEELHRIDQLISEHMPLDLTYVGADWSLAPLPNGPDSVVDLIERVSGYPLGALGALSTIKELTQCLKKPQENPAIRACGFNGVMLSVLEDDVLARRVEAGAVSVNDLMLYSTVCGCGLDMLPIEGTSSESAIGRAAVDTATLAFKLKKPLGVRFLPIQGLSAGQPTSFEHDFVNNCSVLRLE